MPLTKAQLVAAFVQHGATRANGFVSIPEDNCIALALRIRALATDIPPTVPDADVDEYLDESNKLIELRDNSPNPITRGIARRLLKG